MIEWRHRHRTRPPSRLPGDPIQRAHRPALLAVAATLLLACASSRVENVWTAPELEGRRLGLRKVATVAMLQEGALRRVAEDALARAIRESGPEEGGGTEAVPSYTLLDADTLDDTDETQSRLARAGFDGAVVLSVVDEKQRVTSTPGMRAGWGYYGRWGVGYDTASIRTDTVVRVQTSIYSVGSGEGAGELLWSGVTRTLNPRDVEDFVDDVARDVGHQLREQGLVP